MKALHYLKELENHGFKAYVVGGYVRDHILGKESLDIDITTDARPAEIAKIFGLNSADKLGSINIKSGDYNVDITTFRKEKNYFGHKPKNVYFISDLLTDLKRRDFTINAICMNSNGELVDPLNGITDLNNSEIKVIGKVKKKFSEDPLRMLRAIRLSITNNLHLGEQELLFIINNKNLFGRISYTRKKEEIDRILASENSVNGLNFLKNLNLLEVLEIDFDRDIEYVEDYLGMWAQLSFSDSYQFTKLESSRIENIRSIINSNKIDEFTIFEYGLYDTQVAASIMGITREQVMKLNEKMGIHSKDELKIDGNMIMDLLKTKDGKLIKEIKKDLTKQVVSGNLSNDEELLKKYVLEKWK